MTRKKERGQLIVLSGPSGVGKSTVIAELLGQRDNIYFSVSYTTRQPRVGEQNGVNYNFVSREEFERMIAADEKLAAGIDVLLDIEVQGAAKVRERCPDALFIFIIPPSFEELSRRLHRRNTDSEDVIAGRLEKARQEFREIPKYDYLVINDKVSNAVEEIAAILTAAECRVPNRSHMLAQFA